MNKTSRKINPAVWCTYMVLLMLPEMLMLNTKTWWDAPVSIAFNVLFYGVFTWIFCALASLTGKTIERFIHVVLQTVAAAYSISNVFMLVMFNRHWDAYSWQFLSETNGRESSEFFFSYILSFPTLLLLTTYIVLFVAEIVVGRRVARWRIFPSHILPAAGAIVLCAVMLGHTFFFGPDADANYTLAAKYRSPIKRNAIWNIWQSVLTYKSFRDEFARCARSLHNYKEKVTCSEREADVVLIVGESFNRHMSNLYDGKYDTNPRLKALAKQGKLFVFNDVVASDNGTTQNFKQFLSPVAVGDNLSWCDAPLFPFLLRRCGYNVVFYSNQYAGMEMDNEFNASMGFFNAPDIGPYLFDHHNMRTYSYDKQLIDVYCSNRKELESTRRNFIIFHLYGQHTMYGERCPKEFIKFDRRDVKSHLSLNDEQRSVVADYLNATFYNDFIVDSIIRMFSDRNAIVIYFSDHGEEVYNFRMQQGRTDIKTDDPRAMRCQLDIPFMIYASPRYAASHPHTMERIKRSVDRPFMTDNLPQVIFDLLGVHTSYFKPERSVINDEYRQQKRRLLQVGREYL